MLDASVALAWCFPDEVSAAARMLLVSLQGAALRVPALWATEIANGILSGARRRRLPAGVPEQFLAVLMQLPIEVVHEPFEEHVRQAVTLGREQNLTAYDAAYLALALRQQAVLATFDKQLRRAAMRLDIGLLPA
ncbi:MAG: type II toxin-antitoxin system VapC family toxin [Terriglobales bacterium]